jgi:hypothetical protein
MSFEALFICNWNIDIALSVHSIFAFRVVESVLHEEVGILDRQENFEGRLVSCI